MMDGLYDYPLNKPLIFDSHAHYCDEKFDETRKEILRDLPSSGVVGVIECGCDEQGSLSALALAEKYSYIYAAVGIHPENITDNSDLSEIEALSKAKKCVAIGEIGLDYYWKSDNKKTQKYFFENQLILADKLSLPVIVHDREAHADTLELLKKYKPKGVVHSFSGSPEMARELISIGMYIGIGGVITFKNAKRLPEVVSEIPDDRFLLETDSPYLTPVPFRSKINNSSYIYLCAQKIAEIRNCSVIDVLQNSLKNSHILFDL